METSSSYARVSGRFPSNVKAGPGEDQSCVDLVAAARPSCTMFVVYGLIWVVYA